MKKAIVFAGGGSKGAYEYGAWKALRELGEEFDIAAGTSIGSINAALYVQQDFDIATLVWNQMNMDHVMVNGINLDLRLKSLIEQRKNVLPFFKTYINSKGADITPFISTVASTTNEERFFASGIDFALITVKFPGLEAVEITKKDIKPGYLNKWIVASCACFPIFPLCEIDEQSYMDGGYYDNIPIASAFRLGAERVVAIDLNHKAGHHAYTRHPYVTYIKPSVDLGSFMRFDRDELNRMIMLGYNDTLKAFGKCCGNKYTFLLPDLERLKKYSRVFLRTITENEVSPGIKEGFITARLPMHAVLTDTITEDSPVLPVSELDYFLLALEKIMELFNFEYENTYTFEEVFNHLIKETQDNTGIFEENGKEYPQKDSRNSTNRKLTALILERAEKLTKAKKIFENDHEKEIALAMINTIRNLQTR